MSPVTRRGIGGELIPAEAAQTEVKQDNGTFVDILTHKQAIEVEFAEKWAESIGQALAYGISTGRRPTVVLLLREPRDARFIRRILPVAAKAEVDVLVYHVTEIINE